MNEPQIAAAFLASRKIPVAVTGVIRGPATYLMLLAPQVAFKVRELTRIIPDLEAYLATMRAHAGIETPVLVRYDERAVALEISRPDPRVLRWRWLMAKQPMIALLGERITRRGARVVHWDMRDPATPHALVAGTTGSGKSNLIHVALLSLMAATPPGALRILIADMKGDLGGLKNAPHVARFVTDPVDALSLIRDAQYAMNDDARPYRILLVVDEAARLSLHDRKLAHDARAALSDIAQVGRSRGVHMLASTQHPNDAAVAYLMKANLPLRIVGVVNDAQASVVSLGVANANAHKLPGRGAFLIRAGGHIFNMQAWLVTRDVIAQAVQKLRQKWPTERHGRVIPMPTAPRPQPQPQPQSLDEVLAQYARDGVLHHGSGWLMTAATLMNDGKRPTGNRYVALKRRIIEYAKRHGYAVEERPARRHNL